MGPLVHEAYQDNQQWELVDIVEGRNICYYDCCTNVSQVTLDNDGFVHAIYSIRVKRKVTFFALVLLLPSCLLCVLTLIVFLLPPDSTDRIQIGKSVGAVQPGLGVG